MPSNRTKGKTTFTVELPTPVIEAFRRFAKSRGETLSFALEVALRRHMAYPPPPPAPPALPPLPDADPNQPAFPVGDTPPPARPRKRGK